MIDFYLYHHYFYIQYNCYYKNYRLLLVCNNFHFLIQKENLHFSMQSCNFQEIIFMLLQTDLNPNPKKPDYSKWGYFINYPLEWLNSLSREPFISGSRSTPHFNQKSHFLSVFFNYKSFQVSWRWIDWLFC